MKPLGDLHALAEEMKAAQDAAHQLAPFTTRYRDFDLEAAYEVSRLVHQMRMAEGARPVGRKIGFTNPAMWSLHGVREPIWAHVYDRTVVLMDGNAATCPLARFTEPRIEPEIVLHFREPPPLAAGPQGILATVDWVAHGFEIVQSHFPGWKFAAPDTVADCALHGTLFVGPRVPVDRLALDPVAALESFRLELTRDGRHVESGRGSNVLGSPLSAIVHLVATLDRQPAMKKLGAGELVTTGTITTAQSVHPGETWRTDVHGIALPGLELRFLA